MLMETSYILMLHGKFENFGLCEVIYKKSFLFNFWVYNIIFGKSEIAVLKNTSFYAFWCFHLYFASNICIGWFFKHLSNFEQNWHGIGSLKWVWIKKFSKKSIFCEDVKLTTKRYAKFRVNNCNATDVNQEKTEGGGWGADPSPAPRR